jgi:LemA protein
VVGWEEVAGAAVDLVAGLEAVDRSAEDRLAGAVARPEEVAEQAGSQIGQCRLEFPRRSCLRLDQSRSVFMGRILGIIVVVILAVVLLGGGCVYSGYKRAITMEEAVKGSWAEVDNQLQRRFDLIDNLVATVKGVAAQEQKIFLGIADARKAYFQAQKSGNVDQQAAAATQMESALSRLLFLQETYPELKSNESFLKLQDTLEGTENRLGVARNGYNERVKELNSFVRVFPNSFYASLAGVQPAQYFEPPPEAKVNPRVNFDESAEKAG